MSTIDGEVATFARMDAEAIRRSVESSYLGGMALRITTLYPEQPGHGGIWAQRGIVGGISHHRATPLDEYPIVYSLNVQRIQALRAPNEPPLSVEGDHKWNLPPEANVSLARDTGEQTITWEPYPGAQFEQLILYPPPSTSK